MFALFLVIHIILGATVAGTAIIAALTLGFDTLTPLLIAAGVGFAAAFPLSWFVAKQINGN